ncbi:hypothetical protein B0H14DRAFT_2583438 [Mycena olivaceomarginata]|nr:hypothetical protein B0H14DRAFT_2583438 [Mycena olivaceomarginata]
MRREDAKKRKGVGSAPNEGGRRKGGNEKGMGIERVVPHTLSRVRTVGRTAAFESCTEGVVGRRAECMQRLANRIDAAVFWAAHLGEVQVLVAYRRRGSDSAPMRLVLDSRTRDLILHCIQEGRLRWSKLASYNPARAGMKPEAAPKTGSDAIFKEKRSFRGGGQQHVNQVKVKHVAAQFMSGVFLNTANIPTFNEWIWEDVEDVDADSDAAAAYDQRMRNDAPL